MSPRSTSRLIMSSIATAAALLGASVVAQGAIRSSELQRRPRPVGRHRSRACPPHAKRTGFYKIPSLRGLWYRPRLLHDGSIASLEELFDAARLDPGYERKGWRAFGVTKGAVPGLEFLTKLSAEDKTALIAFLRSL